MSGNTLISPTLVRKVKLIFNYGLLISLLFIVITLNIDTRIFISALDDNDIDNLLKKIEEKLISSKK